MAACGVLDVTTTACQSERFWLKADFAGGAMGVCEVVTSEQIRLSLSPENEPINPSPWYSFYVEGNGKLTLTLDYGSYDHRYTPKWSRDGTVWQVLPESAYQVSADKKSLNLVLDVEDGVFISAQENLTSAYYHAWLDGLTKRYPDVTRFEVGRSVGGRPIWGIATNPQASNVVMFVGRQHPPEVSGAIAMVAFIERLMSYHPSSCVQGALCGFYQDTNIVFVPLLNPDGVDRGHWRHNLQGIDINRDWRAFASPEIRAVRDLINELTAQASMRVFFDFHSTYRNVFYTQHQGDKTSPQDFATRWLNRAQAKGTYELENARRRTTNLGTSKNYIHRRFGIPAITYELADEAPRDLIQSSAYSLADAMVEELYPYRATDESPDDAS